MPDWALPVLEFKGIHTDQTIGYGRNRFCESTGFALFQFYYHDQ